MRPNEGSLDDALLDLKEAYELLVESHRWDHDRFVESVPSMANQHGEEAAIRMIEAQAEYIRKRAIR